MHTVAWYVIVGTLLVVMALAGTVLRRLPLSASMLYLAVGFVLGRVGLGHLSHEAHAHVLELVTEVAVLISLFTAGLKLRAPLGDPLWRLALRLAVAGMVLTVALVTAAGVWLLGLPLGAAVLLGAILSPTDPVLASDVQVSDPWDADRLRFGLTGEAGLNDGTAFPFVMLGLGLLGQHALGPGLARWVLLDVLWATAAGLGVGALLGSAVGRLVVYLRREHRETVGLDDFLALGLVALAYGVALWVHGYGFLAVFAAGLALRRLEVAHTAGRPAEEVQAMAHAGGETDAVATHPEKATAYMAAAVLGFNQQLERVTEVAVVVVLGLLLARVELPREALWLVPLLFLGVRPVSVGLALLGVERGRARRVLLGWFGVRGVGSLYYLFYALNHGLAPALAARLVPLVLCTVACSVLVHGVSVTPLMRRYERRHR